MPCRTRPRAPRGCLPAVLPANTSSVWVGVEGRDGDECAALADSSSLQNGVLRVKTFRLDPAAWCRHTLRVLGRPELSSSALIPPATRAAGGAVVQVIAYNETFYPARCQQGEGFAVLYRTRPVQPASFEVLDPSGRHLLFRGLCSLGGPGVCKSASFCPTQDVLVRVTAKNGAKGSALVRAGLEYLQCQPTEEWVLAFELRGPYGARFPGSTLVFGVRVLNAPDRLLAFKLAIQIRPAFTFLAFRTSLSVEQEVSGDFLTLSGDVSGAVLVGGLLGWMDLRLDGEHSGLLRAVHVRLDGGAQLMVGGGWFSAGVLGQGGSCLRNGFVDVLADRARCTALLALPSRTQLVHWQGVQAAARVFPARMDVLGVWNTQVVTQVAARCASLDASILEVSSCQRIVPRGPGPGIVMIFFQEQELGVAMRVVQPESIVTRILGGGRLVVLGSLSGRVLDITPFVMTSDVVVCSEGGNVSVGFPVLLRQRCGLANSHLPDLLFLLAGNWTRRGGFRLQPSLLGPGNDRAAALFFRGDEVVPFPLASPDPGRVVVEEGWLRLVERGETSRCVPVSGAFPVPVLPSPPASLHLRLSSAILVVRQDLSKLVPSRAELVSGQLLLSDGSRVDVRDRLGWRVSANLRAGPEWFETLYEPGPANVTFHLPGAPCVETVLDIAIHTSSVISADLLCPRCPAVLAGRADPLARRWPDRFPFRVPTDLFVVRRILVDGNVHDGFEAPQVSGPGVVEDGNIVAVQAGVVHVTTAFTRGSVEVPVVERWAVSWRLLCNRKECDPRTKLAPEGDGASLAPFRYLSRLEVAVELSLYNGTVLIEPDPPSAILLVNGVNLPFPAIPLQAGPLVVRVVLGPDWGFILSEAAVGLEVHTLASLQLSVPPVLKQLHCSRVWQRGELSLQAVLSDGVRAAVSGRISVDGTFLRLDRTGVFVEALWPGRGWVNASYGQSRVSAEVLVTMDSLFFTGLSLDAIPSTWLAPRLARLPMHVSLEPAVDTGSRMQLLAQVVRWQTEPVGIVDILPSGELSLLSDHYEPVLISAIIRSCQGASPLVFRRSIQVNLVADRPWQVDFGQDADGPPLPAVPVGGQLVVPVFLFCASPLTLYKAVVSLPGVDLASTCAPGQLPLSQCVVRKSGSTVELSGSFPASRRTGRLLLGSFQGIVLVNGLSRLRVSLAEPGNTTYEFTVRLGVGPVHSVLSRLNSVVAGFSEPVLSEWVEQAPTDLRACCDVLAAGAGSSIAHLVPSSFRLRNITLYPGGTLLSLTDPRLQVEFDRLLLEFDAGTETWTVRRQVPMFEDFTQILLDYLHPGTAESLQASILITLTEPDELVLSPSELGLMRVHCSPSVFQAGPVIVHLILRGGTVIPLSGADIANASVQDPSLASVAVLTDQLLLTGLSVGNTTLVVSAFLLRAAIPVVVQDESVVLHSVSMPNPYILRAPHGQPVPLAISGMLENSEALANAGFLVETVTLGSPVAEWRDGGLVPLENTHPALAYHVVAVIPACSGSPAFVVSSSLIVRLRASSLPDVTVDAGSTGLNVTLVAEWVLAFVVTLRFSESEKASCLPGPSWPILADCAVESDRIILAGAYSEPRPGPVLLATLVYASLPLQLGGFVEVFTGLAGSVRREIVAGRIGNLSSGMPASLPAADPATLARQYLFALSRPFDQQAMRETLFTLQLLADRQRLVDVRLYSNEFELSAMFGVVDRFLAPDEARTVLDVVFHSRKLPHHPNATDVAEGIRVRAHHFIDGWYVVQWAEPIPHLRLRVSYEVSTTTSLAPWEHAVQDPLITGRPLHECPRLATDRASFLVVYRILGPLPADWSDAHFACAARVPVRRVSVRGPENGVVIASVAYESFIRIAQAYQAIRMHNVPARRLLRAPDGLDVLDLRVINDTADPVKPCPPGTYYTRNGTYERLPAHAVLGPDCYGMACAEGYLLVGAECVPVPVSMELVWVCVSVIFGLILLISCILCALYLGRRAPVQQQVDLVSESWPGSSHPSDPFVEDDQEFKNIVLGSYLDDYSKDMLDDEFNPVGSPLPAVPSYRLAST